MISAPRVWCSAAQVLCMLSSCLLLIKLISLNFVLALREAHHPTVNRKWNILKLYFISPKDKLTYGNKFYKINTVQYKDLYFYRRKCYIL